jgi:hypothetical protein
MNLSDLALRVDLYLLNSGGWVSVDDICQHCSVPERLLRADGKRRPIFTRFAISSSSKGLKHLAHTTARERITYKHARKKVLVQYARALKEFDTAVHNCITGRPRIERHTGQALLFQP